MSAGVTSVGTTITRIPIAVISNRLWRDEFSADPRLIGRPISVNGEDYTVVGVAPASLTYPANPDIWIPFVFEPWMVDPENRGAHFLLGGGGDLHV